MQLGLTHQGTLPLLRVYRGFNPLDPRSGSSTYPVLAADVSRIKSGMVIFPKWNSALARTEWVLFPTGVTSPEPHIALTDANRSDVVAADSLVGLPCSGEFEMHTPYFIKTTTADYVQGAVLTWAAADDTDALVGKLVTTSGTGNPVVGQITQHLPFDVSAEDTSFTAATANDKLVIKFRTCFVPIAVADPTP